MASDQGALLEARVARLLHAEGWFVRTDVDLNTQLREPFGVTDLDVLAFAFDKTLDVRVINGECKATESRNAPSSGDRLLWLTGVSRLLATDRSFLVTARKASDNARALAARLDSELLDIRDLERREQLMHLTADSAFGTHAPELVELRTTVRTVIGTDPDLQRAYRFVRSDLWLLEPAAALKRSIGACRLLASRYADGLPDPQRQALLWMSAEAMTGFVLALTRVAAAAYRQPEDVFERQFHERLSEGLTTFAAMRDLSKAVDKFVVGLLGQLGRSAAEIAGSMGAFDPKPPPYAETLTELVQRLALSAPAAADLPRLAEHYLLSALHPVVEATPVPAADEAETGRLLRLVAAFLEHQAAVPTVLVEPLRDAGRTTRPRPAIAPSRSTTPRPERPRSTVRGESRSRVPAHASARAAQERDEGAPTLFIEPIEPEE